MDLKHTKSSEERWFEKETCGEIPFCKMLKNAKTVEWRSNLEAWHWGWEWGWKIMGDRGGWNFSVLQSHWDLNGSFMTPAITQDYNLVCLFSGSS